MTKRTTPGSGQGDLARRTGKQPANPLERLRRLVDAAVTESDERIDTDTREWEVRIAQSGVLRRARLSDFALEMVAELTPPASVTEEHRARLEAERRAVRDSVRAKAALESECTVTSPSDLFRTLREREGVSAEQVATLFDVSPTKWLAVERQEQPWYRLRVEALPAFAEAVREPVDRLLEFIAIAARRSLLSGIERRVNLSLGRFDYTQGEAEARLDVLRLAYARVQDENLGARHFLDRARRAAGLPSVHSKRSKQQQKPENG